MVNDQEPRYRLVDSNGNVVGSLFQNADGNVEIQDETGTGSVFGPNGIVTPAIDAESVSTEDLAIPQLFKTARSDTELDNVNKDATIYLASASFDDNRTLSARVHISGVYRGGNGTVVGGDWTLNNRHSLVGHVQIDVDGSITTGDERIAFNCIVIFGDININNDRCVLSNLEGTGTVTFAEGTSDGSIGPASGALTIIDDGNNEVLT